LICHARRRKKGTTATRREKEEVGRLVAGEEAEPERTAGRNGADASGQGERHRLLERRAQYVDGRGNSGLVESCWRWQGGAMLLPGERRG